MEEVAFDFNLSNLSICGMSVRVYNAKNLPIPFRYHRDSYSSGAGQFLLSSAVILLVVWTIIMSSFGQIEEGARKSLIYLTRKAFLEHAIVELVL